MESLFIEWIISDSLSKEDCVIYIVCAVFLLF